jgi:hypothetical protein
MSSAPCSSQISKILSSFSSNARTTNNNEPGYSNQFLELSSPLPAEGHGSVCHLIDGEIPSSFQQTF